MTSAARVIGLGSSIAGDDGVGLAIAEEVRLRVPKLDVALVRDATDLVELLAFDGPVIIVDAVRTDRHTPGTLLELTPAELAATSPARTSHGIDVGQAIAIAEAIGPITTDLRILGVAIGPVELGGGISAPVERAVAPAVARLTRDLR